MRSRSWLHCSGLFPYAIPVLVLARGPKRAHVRLVHRLRWHRKWFAAGSTRYVPTEALGRVPSPGYLVDVGRSRFIPPSKPAAVAAVRRFSGSNK